MRRFSTITLVAGLMLGLTACGGGGADQEPEAEQSAEPQARPKLGKLYATALDDMASLETLRVAGWIDDEGERLDLEIQMTSAGDCQGHVDQGTSGGFDIIGLDGVYFLKPDDAFWRTQVGARADGVIAVVGGRWVSSSGDETKAFRQFCDLGEFVDSLDQEQIKSSDVTGQPQTADGVDAWLFHEQTSSNDRPAPLLWITVDAPHRILKMEDPWGADPGAYQLAGFDEPFEGRKPAAKEVVELADLVPGEAV